MMPPVASAALVWQLLLLRLPLRAIKRIASTLYRTLINATSPSCAQTSRRPRLYWARCRSNTGGSSSATRISNTLKALPQAQAHAPLQTLPRLQAHAPLQALLPPQAHAPFQASQSPKAAASVSPPSLLTVMLTHAGFLLSASAMWKASQAA